MYCKHCGKEITDDIVNCPSCGHVVNEQSKPPKPHSKFGLGIVFSLIYGFLGLIIGLCMYAPQSHDRESFVSGWVTMFFLSLIPSFFLIGFLFNFINALLSVLPL